MNVPVGFLGSSLGAGEILLILVVILLLFGAERLPAAARLLGKALAELRRASQQFTHEITGGNQNADQRNRGTEKDPRRG